MSYVHSCTILVLLLDSHASYARTLLLHERSSESDEQARYETREYGF